MLQQPQMERIKVEVQAQNKQMTNSAKALKDALVVAVNTEGLREKMVQKFIGYLTDNVKTKDLTPEERKRAEQPILPPSANKPK